MPSNTHESRRIWVQKSSRWNYSCIYRLTPISGLDGTNWSEALRLWGLWNRCFSAGILSLFNCAFNSSLFFRHSSRSSISLSTILLTWLVEMECFLMCWRVKDLTVLVSMLEAEEFGTGSRPRARICAKQAWIQMMLIVYPFRRTWISSSEIMRINYFLGSPLSRLGAFTFWMTCLSCISFQAQLLFLCYPLLHIWLLPQVQQPADEQE